MSFAPRSPSAGALLQFMVLVFGVATATKRRKLVPILIFTVTGIIYLIYIICKSFKIFDIPYALGYNNIVNENP